MGTSVYISGALIGSSELERARAKYETCAAFLSDAGLTPYLPHKNTDPNFRAETTAEDVFATDIRALMSSDVVVAFLDEPSHGVGAEIAICIARKIPIVALVPSNVRASRFILGMLKKSKASVIVEYDRLEELADVLPIKIEEVLQLREISSDDGLQALLQRA